MSAGITNDDKKDGLDKAQERQCRGVRIRCRKKMHKDLTGRKAGREAMSKRKGGEKT